MYNALLRNHVSYPVPARIFGERVDILRPDLDIFAIGRWNPETQSGDIIAQLSGSIWVGDTPIFPGEALLVYSASTVGIPIGKRTPTRLYIDAAPNPFNSSCAITVPMGTEIEICDVRGNVISGLRQARRPDSRSLSEVEMTDERTFIWTPDKSIPSGAYLIKACTTDGREMTKRVVLVR